MGKRLTASGSFTVATIEDGVSVQAQYTPDPTSSQIHTVWQEGDLYMRTRESNDSTWSDWHRIVGESGDETDYKFGISEQKVTDSASIPPSDIADEDWDDAPMAVTTLKPFLWSRVQKKVWNAASQGYDIESTRYIRLTGEDGTSVIAQYAPNTSPTEEQTHNTWRNGDLYMRTKTTGGNWSDWHKIVGENGDETDYKFNISDLKTGVNDSTASSHLGGGWEDAPKVVTNTFPYLWTRIVKRVWDETQQKYVDSDPSFSRLTGEQGEAGFDAPSVELSRTNILYDANKDGVSTLQQDFHITYSLVVKSVSCTIANVSDIVITLPTNMSIVANTKTTSAVTLRIPNNTSVQGVVTIQMKGTQGGRKYTATSTITVDGRKQGEKGYDGDRGKTGRFYYYAGEWDDFGNNDAWVVSDAQAPFFGYTPTGNTHGYYVFNPDENRTFTKAQIHDTYGDPNANHAPWVKMWGDFKYIITEAIFGDYAHFGSAIINGDWLLSSNGKVNGSEMTKNDNIVGALIRSSSNTSFSVKPYTLFDTTNPLNDHEPLSSSDTAITIGPSGTTKTITSTYLVAGRVYQLSIFGRKYTSDSTVYVRIRNDYYGKYQAIYLSTTTISQYYATFKVETSATYTVELYQPTPPSSSSGGGSVTSYSLYWLLYKPAYAVDLKTGESYQTRVYASGGMRSPFSYLAQGGTFTEKMSDNIGIYSTSANSGTNYYIPCDVSQSGRKICVTNYYFNGQSSVGSGWATLNMSDRGGDQYFYEDGIRKTTLKLSREGVELLGYGNETTFYGWIVIKRFDLGTVSRYGHHMKMLAVANVNVTKSGSTTSANISYHSFDGTTLSVTRNSVGNYTVSWDNSNWFANASSVFVMICGLGTTVDEGDNSVYASVRSKTSTSFVAQVADDATLNDGSFSFFLMNFDDWVYLH